MPIPGNLLSPVTEACDPTISGWTPLLNCTLSKGTLGRNGDGTVRLTSVAAGETRARTVSSYPVTPGSVYQAFADASGSVVAERIGIRWLTAVTGTELGITWSLTTAAPSAAWHRIGVAGPAPAGAARAQVILASMTPAAGGVTQAFENVYLGPPHRTIGNLLPFETESVEVDVSGWTAQANCAVSRTAPAVTWPVDAYLAGGQVLTLTVTAAGNANARTASRFAVTPGTEYLASCHLSPPTAGSATWIELRYMDAGGAQLSATRSTLAAPGTGFYQQRASATAPAAAVTCEVAVGITGASAGQVMRAETVAVTVAPPVQTGSILPTADATFEQSVAGWTVPTGVATLARSAPWGAAALHGAYSLTVTSATASASVLRSARFPITDTDDSYRVRTGQQVTAGGWTLAVGVRWYDAANASLGLSSSPAAAAQTPGWWTPSWDTGVPPAGATQAAVELTLTATTTASVLQLDAVSLWPALPLVQVAVHPQTASVTVTLRELPAGRWLRLSRVTAAGARSLVRGPSGLYDGTVPITSDTLICEDYEAPLGVPVHYEAEIADPAGGPSETRTTDTVTIPHDDVNAGWIKDPANPQRNTMVTIAARPVWTRPVEQSATTVKNRRNKIIRSAVRNGREGELTVWTESDQERERLDWLLDTGATLLWQTGPGVGIGNLYVSVGATTETGEAHDAQDPFRIWALPLTEQDMPVTVGVNGSAGRTWQDVLAEHATWADVLASYATWEDVLLNRRRP
ncbi:hypothetical protein [Streptomyces sp. CAU 1734]|uniref:hypothetical protein n=1 Tax=Streptomyces sp. CAU 1734 TaxID=3140360 RepID=UPI0032615B9E